MKILICDDEKHITEQMEEMCRRYAEEEGAEFEVLAVNDFGDRGEFEADVIFLDVEMPGKNGILIKDELEEAEVDSLIIFVTNYIGNVYDAFGRNVIGFFPKPLEYIQFCKLIEKVNNLLRGRATVNIDPYISVKADEIRYIKMDGMYSEVYLIGDDPKHPRAVRKSLAEWERILPDGVFMMISKSCIVNCGHIAKLQGDALVMEDLGEVLHISRRRKTECAQKYQKYCRRMMRYGR